MKYIDNVIFSFIDSILICSFIQFHCCSYCLHLHHLRNLHASRSAVGEYTLSALFRPRLSNIFDYRHIDKQHYMYTPRIHANNIHDSIIRDFQ